VSNPDFEKPGKTCSIVGENRILKSRTHLFRNIGLRKETQKNKKNGYESQRQHYGEDGLGGGSTELIVGVVPVWPKRNNGADQ